MVFKSNLNAVCCQFNKHWIIKDNRKMLPPKPDKEERGFPHLKSLCEVNGCGTFERKGDLQ